MDFLVEVVTKIAQGSGFAALDIKTVIMLGVACVLLYMGIGKGFEPLLLVPIAFGMLLANLPVTGLFAEPVYDPVTHSGTVGFMWVLYQGVQYAIYPSIIFMGIGAMTDFGPLLANPMSLMLGAAAQLGIFAAFLMALVLGPITGGVISFTPADAAAIGVIGGVEFLAVLSVLGVVLYRGALKLCSEGKLLMVQLPVWLEQFDLWLTGNCHRVEHAMGLRPGCVADMAGDMLYHMVDTCKTAAMPFLMANSMSVLSCLAKAAIVSLVVFLAAILSLQEMEDLRDRRDQSVFRKEFNMIGNRLVQTGKAWFRSQGIILFITTGLCIGGMFLIRNPYYIMAGIGIGILDALPIFGTGTVLIPWAVLRLAVGDWKQALALTALYLVCYFVRQILEVRMMGGQVGLSPLETLASVYVGLELFGFFGFILGPLGLLLTEDMVEAWTKEVERET